MTVDAVRFYERRGLLRKPPRTSGGFRTYTAEDVRDLEFVRSVHDLGFSLEEIREFLLLRRDSRHACTTVRDLLTDKLRDVTTKCDRMAKLRRELNAALKKCKREISSHRLGKASCPVLAELQSTKKRASR